MSGQPYPYSQTILLDANRRQSVEFSASNLAQTNNAIFKNQVSSGITLDIGDQVSVQSAHISQRGAGGDIIEFAGKVLGQKDITYTKQTNSSYAGTGTFLIDNNADEEIQATPEGFAIEENENITEQIQEKDNEASVVISYYKNTNGENYITLPRNFGNASSPQIHNPTYSGGALTTNACFWEVPDGFPIGANTYPQQASHVLDTDWQVVEGRDFSNAICYFRKLRNDNSRFTLFKQTLIIWNNNYSGTVGANSSATRYLLNQDTDADSGSFTIKCDPAVHNYIKVMEKVPVGVNVGFNSPASVASDVTNQLTKTEDPVFIAPANNLEVSLYQDAESVYINSTLNRAFPSTNYTTFSALNNTQYFNATNSSNLPITALGPPTGPAVGGYGGFDENRACQYLNSYGYVGFKRPEFVEAGRANAFKTTATAGAAGCSVLTEIISANASSAQITTNLFYNDENLIKMKTFFDSQILYPELLTEAISAGVGVQTNYSVAFNSTTASLSGSFAEEARFLHLDLKKTAAHTNDQLGDDMYNVLHSASTKTMSNASLLKNASDKSSVPLFIAFNNNSSHLTASETPASQYGNLAYGFARKIDLGAGNVYIGFETEKIGGIPDSYYAEQVGKIKVGTKLGYDYHFNAYGNAAIIPSSGFTGLQYFGKTAFAVARTCRQSYIGANNPVFKFNSVDGRFEFENLHTSEKVGNFYNAGDPNPAVSVFGPPESGQAGQDCYKIDKQLHYTTWSPSMFPYSKIDIQSGCGTTGTQAKTFVKVNANLDLGRIYDAHGGVTIEDLGFSEKNFDLGFWGLLGYEFGQFNTSGTGAKNRLIRYQNDSSNVNGMTTNADITSVDSQNYINNIFGANLFTQQLSSRGKFWITAQKMGDLAVGASNTVGTTSVILANSTRITGAKLPRRILRGYFLICSDLLDQANYLQTANPLQTMAMVGKYNGANGFIEYDGGGAIFTVTRKKTITEITTQILDPEGNLAQVGDNSGIIYRIDKQINTDLKFAENLLAGMK